MNKNGFGLIENLLLLSVVILAVSYFLIILQNIEKTERTSINHDSIYEKAYE